MHRRGFLALSTALLLPPLTGAAEQLAEQRPALSRVAAVRAELVLYARSINSKHAIGSAWLKAQPQKPTLDQLLDELAAQLAETAAAHTQQPDLGGLVALQVRHDFSAGRVVNLNGWMLSTTETRLCGIACLLANRAALS